MVKRVCPECETEWYTAAAESTSTCSECGAPLGPELNKPAEEKKEAGRALAPQK